VYVYPRTAGGQGDRLLGIGLVLKPTSSPWAFHLALELSNTRWEIAMSEDNKIATTAARLGLSLDAWAVFGAFLLALLVRAGILKHVPW